MSSHERADDDAPLLVADGVHRAFGGRVAVAVDHFEARAGTAVALIGPNGAGKTTFLDVVTGFTPADRGEVTFRGTSLLGSSPDRIARVGVVRTFQRARVFPRATVLENVMLGAMHHRGELLRWAPVRAWWRGTEREVAEQARELLDRVGLDAARDALASTLSVGQARLCELARVLMCQPQLLLLDEPTAGVAPVLVERIVGQLEALRAEGLGIVFVEHDLRTVARLADEVVCLADGEVLARGTAAEVSVDPAVARAYLGTGGR